MIVKVRRMEMGNGKTKLFVSIEKDNLEVYEVEEAYLTNELTGKTINLKNNDESIIDADYFFQRKNYIIIYISRPYNIMNVKQ
ncbi:hypothetical protein J7L13_00205 [bacterium]|nr:hypothetical protein [bacterium]